MAETLTDFLLARIADDEAMWTMARDGGMVITVNGQSAIPPQPWVETRLAECEAKRRIVAAFEYERARRDIYNRDYSSGEYDFNENDLRSRLASNAECRGLEIAMHAHAATYADHPDYRQEWKP